VEHAQRIAYPPSEALALLAPMLARPTDSSALEYANATFVLASNLGADAVTARSASTTALKA
jgi:hypothetical protein